MTRNRIAAMWLGAALCAIAPLAHATVYRFAVVLDGASESPANASPGSGTGLVVFDDAAQTMALSVVFADLLGTTTASHIHCCTLPPGNIGVATPTPTFPGFPLGVTAGSYDHTLDLTLAASFNAPFLAANGGTPASASAALLAGLQAGQAYWNIHTSFATGGEIRGFLQQQVSEPASAALVLAGALLGGWLGRRRSRRA